MTNAMIGTLWLLVAIATDVISTFYMAKANGLQDKLSLAIGAVLYIGSFIACVVALKYIQAGVLYVLWAGIGAIATVFLAQVFLGQRLDTGAWIGLSLIVMGTNSISRFTIQYWSGNKAIFSEIIV